MTSPRLFHRRFISLEALTALAVFHFVCSAGNAAETPAAVQPPSPAEVTGLYFGQQPPAHGAAVFAPGLVSLPRGEGEFAERPVFSPDGRECFFDVTDYKTKTFTSVAMRCENGVWSKPEPAFFSRNGGFQASIAPDGQTLYFAGPSPTDPKVRGIWMSQRESSGWADPVFLHPPVNTAAGAGFPCAVRDGALYYFVLSGSDKGLHRAPRVDRHFSRAETVPAFQPRSNCIFGDFFVAPDESYLVIYSTLPDNLGNGELYVSFRNADGNWTAPRNLGPEVNTQGYDFAPSLSPDGQYLFFTRDVPGDTGKVYWISTAEFRPHNP